MKRPTDIIKFKKILDKAKKASVKTPNTWYSIFKMRENPFMPDQINDDVEYFVNQEEITKSIIFDIGVSTRGILPIELLVGPSGSGKSSILKYVHTMMNLLSKEESKYHFKGNLISAKSLFTEIDGVLPSKELHELHIIQKKEYDYLLFDDVTPNQILYLMNEFKNTNLKLFSISTKHLNFVRRLINQTPTVYTIDLLNFKNTKTMLEKRIKRSLTDSDSITLNDIFEDNVLQLMFEYCFYVPQLVLECAAASLQILIDKYQQTSIRIRKHKVTRDIILSSCKIIKCYQAYENYDKIGNYQYAVLSKIIDKAKSSTKISFEIQKDRTTVSRHLKELKDQGLIESVQDGKELRYRITKPARIFMEIKLLKEISHSN
ncbi:MAG: winged helix-turn-helix transcriptional regulator [Thaumarchaeota archaeon]|nr:winged helix-turn-helix transcriptional regulator [Nitrososphaerota archaeon]